MFFSLVSLYFFQFQKNLFCFAWNKVKQRSNIRNVKTGRDSRNLSLSFSIPCYDHDQLELLSWAAAAAVLLCGLVLPSFTLPFRDNSSVSEYKSERTLITALYLHTRSPKLNFWLLVVDVVKIVGGLPLKVHTRAVEALEQVSKNTIVESSRRESGLLGLLESQVYRPAFGLLLVLTGTPFSAEEIVFSLSSLSLSKGTPRLGPRL